MIGPYRNFLRAMRVRKLTPRRAEILLMIQEDGPQRPGNFIKTLRSAAPNIDTDIHWLLDQKMIRHDKTQPADDRRHRFYVLTAKGKDAVVNMVATA